MNKIYVSWEEFGSMIENLADQIIESKEEFDGVYGVPRGGLPIAVALSHRLNLPVLLYPTKETLVVDDISDTGMTLQRIRNKKIACLYTTQFTRTSPNYHVDHKVSPDDWIIFPWETK